MVVANRVIGRSDRFQRRLSSQEGRAMASRVNREVYARFCGRLEVKFLRPTRRLRTPRVEVFCHVTIIRNARPANNFRYVTKYVYSWAGAATVVAKASRVISYGLPSADPAIELLCGSKNLSIS